MKTHAPPAVTIKEAQAPQDMPVVAAIFREYAAELQVDLCFQGFEEELAALPDAYARPQGAIWLAEVAGEVIGCIALRPLENSENQYKRCEVKRLYVRAAHRASGAGRMLATTLLEEARRIGYQEAVLDTLTAMHAARSLYTSLGFQVRAPYYHNPLPGVIYMARRLT